VYLSDTIDLKLFNIKAIINGTQVGSYFGGALAVCDVNDDNVDELIIGAPLFTVDQDEGKAYIYQSIIQVSEYIIINNK
jgi:hypothetical protein